MTTDINKLISREFRGGNARPRSRPPFRNSNLIVAVVDAPTPELVSEATQALVQRLTQQPELVPLCHPAEAVANFLPATGCCSKRRKNWRRK